MEKKAKNTKKTMIILGIVLGVLVLAVAGLAVWYFTQVAPASLNPAEQALFDEIQSSRDNKTFLEGVSIDGVDVGGMSFTEARAAIDDAHAKTLADMEYTFDIDGQTVVIKQSNGFIVNYDLRNVMNKAYNVIDLSDAKAAVKEYETIKSEGRNFETSPEIDEDSLKNKLETVADKYTTKAKDATWKINMSAPEGKKVEIVEGQSGVTIDTNAMYDEITRLFSEGKGGTLEVATTVVEPEVTAESLENKYSFRASAVTSYNDASHGYATRVHNIEKATGHVNGTVLKPGDIFSMNRTIGDRTYANGYQAGGALVNGSTETQAGGGVCQVATTLYNAVVKSDLEIVYRQNHSEKLSYVEGGLDATINTGTIDFKFKNNTNSDILIVGYNVNRHVYFEIYGEKFSGDFDKITLSSKQTGVVNPSGEMAYQVVKGKPASYKEVKQKRKIGSTWISYKNYWKDGKIIKTETLAKSTYKAFNGITLIGEGSDLDPNKPEVAPTPTASSTAPTPTTPAPTPSAPAPSASGSSGSGE